MKMVGSAQNDGGLSFGQSAMLVAIGIALWFVAAMLLRQIAPLGVFDGPARIALYALTVPGTWPFVLLTQRLVRLAPDQIVPGIALVTAAALLTDSFVFAWFPWIYGAAEYHRDCAAAVFWGAAVGLLLSFIAAAVRQPAR
ncbi:hypothetical protein [Novosphingobium sp. Chol11]|uniref:hypothetical protein n=1 Tax=Novosphingobium sp. Chol11 TaxID=1385763 RepID=UPI0025F93C28|nr:hypothetical protein [Novosphingobium sp. Chol11]